MVLHGVPVIACDCLCPCPARICCDEIICFEVIRLVPVIAQGSQGLEMDRKGHPNGSNGSIQMGKLSISRLQSSASFATVLPFVLACCHAPTWPLQVSKGDTLATPKAMCLLALLKLMHKFIWTSGRVPEEFRKSGEQKEHQFTEVFRDLQ